MGAWSDTQERLMAQLNAGEPVEQVEAAAAEELARLLDAEEA